MADEILNDEDIELVEINASTIKELIITTLEKGVTEPLYPGDERRIFGEALSPILIQLYNKMNDAARQVMLRYARGAVLDALGARLGITRLEAEKATTTLRFFVSAPQATNIIIPKWTKVTSDGELYFATDETAVLQAGAYSVDVPASGTEGGSQFNGYQIGSLVTLVNQIPYIESVENITVTAGGTDGEPYTEEGDNNFRERIMLAPSKLSTAGPASAYEYWAKTADASIADVKVDSPDENEIVIYPLMDGGALPSADILQKVLDVVSAADIRPMTDHVTAAAPTAKAYNIELTYYVTPAKESQAIINIEGADGAIERFNAWQQAALGRDINPDQLRRLILSPDWGEDLAGAERVAITSPVFTEVGDLEVAHFSGTLVVTHEVVEDV